MRLGIVLLLCAAALPGAGARGKRKGRKGGASAAGSSASHALVDALERARANDEAGARQQATAALTQYQVEAAGRENLGPVLHQAEQLLGFELALQHVVLPVMEIPDQTVAKLKASDNIWTHLDKGPHAGFLLKVAKADAARATDGQGDARSQALRRGLDGLRAYKEREFETGRKLLLEAIELRGAATAEKLLLLLYWQEKRCGFELAVTFFLVPFLGLSDTTLSMVSEQWVAAEDKSPWAQFVRQLRRAPSTLAVSCLPVSLSPVSCLPVSLSLSVSLPHCLAASLYQARPQHPRARGG